MKIIFWGTPDFSVPILEELIKKKHDVIGVVTQPDKKRSRGKKLVPSPIKQKALEYNIKVYETNKISIDKVLKEKIMNEKADVYIVAAFGQLLPNDLIEHPRLGCWNTHASLLPRWRGAAPIQWSILKRDLNTGVGIMLMEETLDTGSILLEEVLPINLLENAETITNKLSVVSANLIIMLLKLLKNIENVNNLDLKNQLALKHQDENLSKISYARMINKEDYLINWENPAIEIHSQIMAFYPNAYSFINNKRVKLIDSEPIDKKYYYEISPEAKELFNLNLIGSHNPGEIININRNSGILVSTGKSLILIKGGQIEGKQKCNGRAFVQQIKSLDINMFSSSYL